MVEREKQGGVAALTALVNSPLQEAIGADGHVVQCGANSSSSNGNGAVNSSSGSNSTVPILPPDAYVWVRPAKAV